MTQATETLQMSHYCAAATSADRITTWDATIYVANGHADESAVCPACGSSVATQPFISDDEA